MGLKTQVQLKSLSLKEVSVFDERIVLWEYLGKRQDNWLKSTVSLFILEQAKFYSPGIYQSIALNAMCF